MTDGNIPRAWLSDDGLTLVVLRPDGNHWECCRRAQGYPDGAWIYSGLAVNTGQHPRVVGGERFRVDGPTDADRKIPGMDLSWRVVDGAYHGVTVAKFSDDYVDGEAWAAKFASDLNAREIELGKAWQRKVG